MPAKRGKARKRIPKPKKPKKLLRYLSYSITVLIVALLIVTIVAYGESNPQVSHPLLESYSSMALSLLLSSAVFSYLIYKGKGPKQIIAELGLSKNKLTIRILALGAMIFFAVMLFSLVLSIISMVTNIQLPTNVQTVLAGTPLYFMVFTFLVAPINEEIFFRGFLVPRIGIILSSILFALAHLSYFSISEFSAALFFGLLAGYIYKKTKSLYPSLLAHMVINLITITSIISFGMLIRI